MEKLKDRKIEKIVAKSGIYTRKEAQKEIAKKNIYQEGNNIVINLNDHKDDLLSKTYTYICNDVSKVKKGIKKATRPFFDYDSKLKKVYISLDRFNEDSNVYVAVNKIGGVVCATKDLKETTIIQTLPFPYNMMDLKIAGRLDKDTTGLIYLTTDGQFIKNMMHPKKKVKKTYMVKLEKALDDEQKNMLLSGVYFKNEDAFFAANDVQILDDPFTVLITISEGKFHQVKRMFEYVGNSVLKLSRVAIGDDNILCIQDVFKKQMLVEFNLDNIV